MPRGLSIVTLRGKSQCLYLRVIATTQMMVFPAIIMLLATTEAIVIERARGPLTTPGPTRIEKSASEVALTWLDDRTLKIRLTDNTMVKILLTPADNIPGLFVPC